MSVLVGSVTHLGAPFDAPPAELVTEQEVGGQLCYVFGDGFLDTEEDVYVEPAEPIGAIVLWDPSWIREGAAERRLLKLRARYADAPVVGVYSDWFSGWYGGKSVHRLGTRRSLDFCNRVVIDRYGAAAIRRYGWKGEIHQLDHFLSYGRLPITASLPLEPPGDARRDIDVSFIGHDHAGFVWQRPEVLEAVKVAARRRGWFARIQSGLTAAEMEEVLLRSKIVVNWQLGTQMNMRCYEAAACGCALVTNDPVPPGAFRAHNSETVIAVCNHLLNHPDTRLASARDVWSWVQNQTPEVTWQRIFTAAQL